VERPNLELVGAVDSNPDFAGSDVGRAIELGRDLGFVVDNSLAAALDGTEADAVIHCTGSSFPIVYDQLAEIVGEGLSCVTSCEEALFPRYRNPELAEELNNLCVSHSVGVLGTGVNPGFVMDTLPVLLTAVSQTVRSIRVLRVVDAGTRREALQRKIGAGLTRQEFQKLADEGNIRHVGLPESLAFLADAIGRPYGDIQETLEPVMRNDGHVAGVKQVATADGLTLELQMFVGAPNPRDEIHIEGNPPLRVVVEGGTAGDLATPAILVNMLPRLMEAGPGLHTMATLPLPRLA